MLRELWNAGKKVSEISDAIGRTILACNQRAHKIGLTCTPERKRILYGGNESFEAWPTDDESIAEFTKAWYSNAETSEIAKRLNRTSKAIRVHAYDLKLGPRHAKPEFKSLGNRSEHVHSYRTCNKCKVALIAKIHFETPRSSVCKDCMPKEKEKPDMQGPVDYWSEDVAIGSMR